MSESLNVEGLRDREVPSDRVGTCGRLPMAATNRDPKKRWSFKKDMLFGWVVKVGDRTL